MCKPYWYQQFSSVENIIAKASKDNKDFMTFMILDGVKDSAEIIHIHQKGSYCRTYTMVQKYKKEKNVISAALLEQCSSRTIDIPRGDNSNSIPVSIFWLEAISLAS